MSNRFKSIYLFKLKYINTLKYTLQKSTIHKWFQYFLPQNNYYQLEAEFYILWIVCCLLSYLCKPGVNQRYIYSFCEKLNISFCQQFKWKFLFMTVFFSGAFTSTLCAKCSHLVKIRQKYNFISNSQLSIWIFDRLIKKL